MNMTVLRFGERHSQHPLCFRIIDECKRETGWVDNDPAGFGLSQGTNAIIEALAERT